MARTKIDPRQLRIIFARIGWMRFYAGSVAGDERPIGGGKHNQTKIGHEVYNFHGSGDRLYGYVQPNMASNTVALERIDPGARHAKVLKHVLVILVARRPKGGQVIVGWYKDAEIHRDRVRQSPGKPRNYGHFFSAPRENCVLLPEEKRECKIPFGKNGMGQSNVCYPLNSDGSSKHAKWLNRASKFVNDYRASNLLCEPEADAVQDSALAVENALGLSKGQGFVLSSEHRRAIEIHSMNAAKRYFRRKGFHVEDVSARRSYDLECIRGHTRFHVEVKGTATAADSIVLTKNEVTHAQDRRHRCILFILHSIRIIGKRASRGQQIVIKPWKPKTSHLVPVSYIYWIRRENVGLDFHFRN